MDPKIVVIAIQGWSESKAARNFSLARKELENIPGVKVLIPEYLDATGKFTKFRSHKKVHEYAIVIRQAYDNVRREYPNARIILVGHSLGGVIARYLHRTISEISDKDLILVAAPNHGIDYRTLGGPFGIVALPVVELLATRPLCNVPVFFQLLKGSKFLKVLNELPAKNAYYIVGSRDSTVSRESADPFGTARVVDCDHHLIPRNPEKAATSAIPEIVKIVKKELVKTETASS
ncbi:MAG: hypothetical protein PHG23_00060 [Candidatus Pacebacteria bacterium]|nr:hypothetical protein [Candidatus Paceibacterota bacterium]